MKSEDCLFLIFLFLLDFRRLKMEIAVFDIIIKLVTKIIFIRKDSILRCNFLSKALFLLIIKELNFNEPASQSSNNKRN
jgi:hypothetical protein